MQYQVSGKKANDARLVAAMRVHGLQRIVTFNTDDFRRFPEIQAIDPVQLREPQREESLGDGGGRSNTLAA